MDKKIPRAYELDFISVQNRKPADLTDLAEQRGGSDGSSHTNTEDISYVYLEMFHTNLKRTRTN